MNNSKINYDRTFTVSELNKEVASLLEASYPSVNLEGEISNLTKHSSGHWYFSLKDDKAQVSCAMFKMNNRQVKMDVEVGVKVNVEAKVSLYAPRGNYQLIINKITPAGIGNLQQAFEALKLKLFNEGLFDRSHKLAIPAFPKKIAIITSPTGAAIRDILTTCQRRFALIPIDIYPCLVQGDKSAKDIDNKLKQALSHQQAELIIIARGGGSIEDLWGFNDENLARTIYQSSIPIISGVGHEIDSTIVDFVADYAAPTPTGAAEIATPDVRIILDTLYSLKSQLSKEMSLSLRTLTQRVDILYHKCSSKSPQAHLNRLRQLSINNHKQIILLQSRLIKDHKQRTLQLQQRLLRAIKRTDFNRLNRQIKQSRSYLKKSMSQRLARTTHTVNNYSHLLSSLGPQQVLKRGYIYLTDKNGNVIKQADELIKQESALAHFHQGEVLIKTINKIT